MASFLVMPHTGGFGSLERAVQEGRISIDEIDTLLLKAEAACRSDLRVTALLGDDITFGGVHSSASCAIRGPMSVLLHLSLSGVGMALLCGELQGGELQLVTLEVSARGHVIQVPVQANGDVGSSAVGGAVGGEVGGYPGGAAGGAASNRTGGGMAGGATGGAAGGVGDGARGSARGGADGAVDSGGEIIDVESW